jgi:hypothetical protein
MLEQESGQIRRAGIDCSLFRWMAKLLFFEPKAMQGGNKPAP